MRVHELAKELGTSSKELLARLHALGVQATNHMSALEAGAAQLAREEYARSGGAAPAPAEATVAPAPAPAVAAAAEAPSAPAAPAVPSPKPSAANVLTIKGPIAVRELAEKLGVRANQLVAKLMQMNVFATIAEKIEFQVARDVAKHFGYTIEHERKAPDHVVLPPVKSRDEGEGTPDRPEDLTPRPPIVTFMGHVDHGKTSLLDRIRKTAVAAGEAGGITQHIGAYTVEEGGRPITFLDTPGHAAFTAMRARGANLTDIVVLVVAADDGVMPQTREAIQHARAANVAIVVAINKVDMPTANPERIRRQLQAEGLAPEEWGGTVICCEVSAATGKGIEHLLEMLLLQAEMLDLKANPKRRAAGYVIEARLEAGMGPTANLLVRDGTLRIGDAVLSGRFWGRVRALINDHGIQVKAAGPGTPIKCLGLSGVPEAGAEFRSLANERVARSKAEEAAGKARLAHVQVPRKASLEDLLGQLKSSDKLVLRLVLKADTQGSIEAIRHALRDIKSEKVSLDILLEGTGNITVNDVMLASASEAVIMGFHVAKEPGTDGAARHEGVEIRLHSIIYELLDEVREAMTGLLAPMLKENIRGRAEIKKVFDIGRGGKVAGCLVISGAVAPRHRVRVRRKDAVVFQGSVTSLKHFKESAAEVRENQECGVRLDNFGDFQEGDILEFYEVEEIKQTL